MTSRNRDVESIIREIAAIDAEIDDGSRLAAFRRIQQRIDLSNELEAAAHDDPALDDD